MPEKERGGLVARGGECTRCCRSRQHADLVTSAITKASDQELISYLSWVCPNAATATDSAGRTALHVAASCGRKKLLEWLVQVHGASLNTEDRESGMTALQRAVFYGQLDCVRALLVLGASTLTQDHADMTALDGVHADRAPGNDLSISLPCEAYVWGTNPWFSIGVERIKARFTPEPLDLFRRAGVWIRQIAMSKFHSVFLTQNGSVHTCGHGIGGRLGHGDEESVLAPKELRSLKGENCAQVAVSPDHTVLLMESGTVWTFGLNHSCQLGHAPPPVQLAAPRLVDWSRGRSPRVTGVCAARYHTVFWNSDSVYCVGLNGGQLGQHKDESKDKRLITPRKVTMWERDSGGGGGLQLTHVACSDGATAAATAAGDVLLLAGYRCRRVASRMLNLRQLRVHGGAPEGAPDGLRQERAAPLRLLLLSAEGWLYIWHQDRPIITRCEVGLRRQLCVADMELDKHGLILISEQGQAFTGSVILPKETEKPPKPTKEGRKSAPAAPRAQVRVTRVPHVHRAVSVTCDGSGGNCGVLQCDPRSALLELPEVSQPELRRDITSLFENADEGDSIHDCVLQAGKVRFPCHRYLLASASAALAQQAAAEATLQVSPPALRQVLLYAYTGTCDLLRPGPTELCLDAEAPQEPAGKGRQRQKPQQAVQVVRELARKLGLTALFRRLDGVRLVSGRVEVPRGFDPSPAPLALDRTSPAAAALADVTLSADDGTVFRCHKCVLAARLEYFNVMFSSYWAEGVTSHTVQLAMPVPVLRLVLQYCYTDAARLSPGHLDDLDTDDLELLCGLLAAADHLMAARLKQMCEVALSRQLTLKNAVEMLEFSALYVADQLKATCMEFICLNLAAILENRSLDQASEPVLDELTRHYRRTNATLRRYRPPPSCSGSPSLQHVREVHAAYPVEWDEALPETTAEEVRSRPPPRRRTARPGSAGGSGPGGEKRQSATSTSFPMSPTSQGSEEGELDLSDLAEWTRPAAAHAVSAAGVTGSPVPEFTLVRRRRQSERRTSESDRPPAQQDPQATPERYIPGITPKPRPVRTLQPMTEPSDDEDQSAPSPAVTSPVEAFPSPEEAFPSLSGDVTASGAGVTSPPLNGQERQRDARRSRKGRRGRVLNLSGNQPPPPVTSPTAEPTCTPTSTPGKPAWGGGTPGAGSVSSLADIMAQQAGSVAQQTDTTEQQTGSVAQQATAPIPAPLPATSPEPLSSPPAVWRTPVSPTNGDAAPPQVTSLNDIIRQERQKIEIRKQMSNKSLALIQIEERAIAELLALYGAEESGAERVTVERVQTDAAEPQWNRRR